MQKKCNTTNNKIQPSREYMNQTTTNEKSTPLSPPVSTNLRPIYLKKSPTKIRRLEDSQQYHCVPQKILKHTESSIL